MVGHQSLMDGREVFKLVDTYGLPLDIINLELRDKGKSFHVPQFIGAANRAGWPKKRVRAMLLANVQAARLCTPIIDRALEIEYDERKTTSTAQYSDTSH